MQVHFVPRENGPERLVTEAEIHFEEGELAGMRLVGFCLWRSAEGDIYVTFPSRAFGVASERKYFDGCEPGPTSSCAKPCAVWSHAA
jgi:hypothetical protein